MCAKHAKYKQKLREGHQKVDALDQVGARRVCCRRMLLSQPNHFALVSRGHDGTDGVTSPLEMQVPVTFTADRSPTSVGSSATGDDD